MVRPGPGCRGAVPRAVAGAARPQPGRVRPSLGPLACRTHVPACSETLILLSPAKVFISLISTRFYGLILEILAHTSKFHCQEIPFEGKTTVSNKPRSRCRQDQAYNQYANTCAVKHGICAC